VWVRVKKEVMLVGANDLHVGSGREHLSHQKYSFLYRMTNDKKESSDRQKSKTAEGYVYTYIYGGGIIYIE